MSENPEYKHASVESLIPYARNARTHSDDQVAKIASSIKEFGFLNPVIVDGENGIIAGHGRVMAAKLLGMDEVPVLQADHLTDDVGFDLDLTGFTADEIAAYSGEINFEPGTEEDQGKLDELEPKWIACPHCGKEFDSRAQS